MNVTGDDQASNRSDEHDSHGRERFRGHLQDDGFDVSLLALTAEVAVEARAVVRVDAILTDSVK